VNDIALVAGLL